MSSFNYPDALWNKQYVWWVDVTSNDRDNIVNVLTYLKSLVQNLISVYHESDSFPDIDEIFDLIDYLWKLYKDKNDYYMPWDSGSYSSWIHDFLDWTDELIEVIKWYKSSWSPLNDSEFKRLINLSNTFIVRITELTESEKDKLRDLTKSNVEKTLDPTEIYH